VDPDVDGVRIYRLTGARYARPIELSAGAGDALRTSLLPGLVMPLTEVFKD
jgi:hypothetical protein